MEARVNELNRFEELQLIALDYARQGKTQDLKILLNSGMSVDLYDYKGNTLLMLASYRENKDTVQLLIDYNAQVDKKNYKGQTPLCGVCFKGNLEIAKILVSNGANIYENNGFGTTPLFFASIFGNTKIVEYFIQSSNNNGFKMRFCLGFSKFIARLRKK